MKVLVVGSGGREHAIAWKLKQSPKVSKVFVAPGNDGMCPACETVPIRVDDLDGLASFAKKNAIHLTVVGPEVALAQGLVDRFKKETLRIVGPDRFASQLEASKLFSKQIMRKANVPTAAYEVFEAFESAQAYLKKVGAPIVIKANGLAAGKGVTVALTEEEALGALREALIDKRFGAAGSKVLIEERLEGEEASLIAISDGRTVLSLASSQDHKRAFDGDLGPNTGGMGAYSPAPVVTDEIMRYAHEHIFIPVIQEFQKQGHPYVGFLYAGVMIKDREVKVLEFNVRLGDPEAQVILPRLESDFYELMELTCDTRLSEAKLQWSSDACVGVVIASEGYPGTYRKGDRITGLGKTHSMKDVCVFHAGTVLKHDEFFTSGGRVLSVTATAKSIPEAKNKAYEGLGHIRFEGMHYRKDIADRATQVVGVVRRD